MIVYEKIKRTLSQIIIMPQSFRQMMKKARKPFSPSFLLKTKDTCLRRFKLASKRYKIYG